MKRKLDHEQIERYNKILKRAYFANGGYSARIHKIGIYLNKRIHRGR